MKLESRLASTSQSHIHELQSCLRIIVKGESIAAQYLQKIKEIADAFASAGAPVANSELIPVILYGFPLEFDSFLDAIQFRLHSTTIDELHDLLLSKEIQFTNRKQTVSAAPFQPYNSSAGIFHLQILLLKLLLLILLLNSLIKVDLWTGITKIKIMATTVSTMAETTTHVTPLKDSTMELDIITLTTIRFHVRFVAN